MPSLAEFCTSAGKQAENAFSDSADINTRSRAATTVLGRSNGDSYDSVAASVAYQAVSALLSTGGSAQDSDNESDSDDATDREDESESACDSVSASVGGDAGPATSWASVLRRGSRDSDMGSRGTGNSIGSGSEQSPR